MRNASILMGYLILFWKVGWEKIARLGGSSPFAILYLLHLRGDPYPEDVRTTQHITVEGGRTSCTSPMLHAWKADSQPAHARVKATTRTLRLATNDGHVKWRFLSRPHGDLRLLWIRHQYLAPLQTREVVMANQLGSAKRGVLSTHTRPRKKNLRQHVRWWRTCVLAHANVQRSTS